MQHGSNDPRQPFGALFDTIATAEARANDTDASGLAIEARPTVYRGTTFRSALEASWAASLDNLAIAWEYEPTTVTLPSGIRYIPDFHLPETGTWLEVKGTGVPRIEKAYEYAEALACNCPRFRCTCRWPGGELVVIGRPPVTIRDHDERGFVRRRTLCLEWASARNRGAWLTLCPDCLQITWFDAPRCRACQGPLAGAHGHQTGSTAFQFTRITGPAAPTTDNPHRKAA
ncbi:hypothetical protein OTB20_19555 [Streptomyces sp. H27-H1]|uniref:hypothetical protein n=1 Tax=Streptomyces sp. H27-H1 TaxID=2996461 RepID=UPI00226DB751|nr:hypothetical protein [Streptomyces sp. H27-H1]MCY0928354.1 hypothetical protein [Streptomyces sp. H27-H1]